MSASIGPSILRRLVDRAAQLLLGSDNTLVDPRLGFNIESRCVVMSILHFFAPQLTSGEEDDDDDDDDGDLTSGSAYFAHVGWNKLRELLNSFFPSSETEYSYSVDSCPVSEELLEAIRAQLQERHLQCRPSLMEKVCYVLKSVHAHCL